MILYLVTVLNEILMNIFSKLKINTSHTLPHYYVCLDRSSKLQTHTRNNENVMARMNICFKCILFTLMSDVATT